MCEEERQLDGAGTCAAELLELLQTLQTLSCSCRAAESSKRPAHVAADGRERKTSNSTLRSYITPRGTFLLSPSMHTLCLRPPLWPFAAARSQCAGRVGRIALCHDPLTHTTPRASPPSATARRPFISRTALSALLFEAWPSSWWSASADEADPSNIFARILRGDAPAAVLDDDGELFSFKDRNPASTLHYLVIPRRFIRDASRLTAEDLELVGQMEAKARLLIQRDVGHTFDPTELALGFHWPPW